MRTGTGGPYPPQHKWMLFVDGENFTIRGQELADKRSIVLTEGRYYCKDTFLWVPGFDLFRTNSLLALRLRKGE
jgi:hypothetical protein